MGAQISPTCLRALAQGAHSRSASKTDSDFRKNLEPSDYKHVALGLIFLKHISNAFEAQRAELLAEDPDAAEDPDEYAAENVFWVPAEARWSHLQANAKLPTIGKLIDDAMAEIEKATGIDEEEAGGGDCALSRQCAHDRASARRADPTGEGHQGRTITRGGDGPQP
jgi:hypothetical protein